MQDATESVDPLDRRRDDDAFTALLERRRGQRTDADRKVAFDRLGWFVNRVLEASHLMLSREHRRRWKGSVAVDATGLRGFARPEKRPRGKAKGKAARVLRHSSDPDCGWYWRTPDDRDEDAGPAAAKGFWGYEASLVVICDSDRGGPSLPTLVIGMAPLHRPGSEPGVNGARALMSIADRGHPADYLAGDRAYSSAKPEDFQLVAGALGYRLVFDYRIDQLGVQAEVHGLIQVEGWWYCPAMPDSLVEATIDLRNDKIDKETYAARIEARQAFEARPKAGSDREGHQRFLCPAAQGAPTARCELKPRSESFGGGTPVRIRPSSELKANPPKACRQQSVTVPPGAGAKFAQALPYASREQHRIYSQLRSSVEGMNGYLKDAAFEGIGVSERRRVRGVAAQSVLVAFQILAANIRKIEAFLSMLPIPLIKLARRRRTTAPLSSWLPGSPAEADASRSPPPE